MRPRASARRRAHLASSAHINYCSPRLGTRQAHQLHTAKLNSSIQDSERSLLCRGDGAACQRVAAQLEVPAVGGATASGPVATPTRRPRVDTKHTSATAAATTAAVKSCTVTGSRTGRPLLRTPPLASRCCAACSAAARRPTAPVEPVRLSHCGAWACQCHCQWHAPPAPQTPAWHWHWQWAHRLV